MLVLAFHYFGKARVNNTVDFLFKDMEKVAAEGGGSNSLFGRIADVLRSISLMVSSCLKTVFGGAGRSFCLIPWRR